MDRGPDLEPREHDYPVAWRGKKLMSDTRFVLLASRAIDFDELEPVGEFLFSLRSPAQEGRRRSVKFLDQPHGIKDRNR